MQTSLAPSRDTAFPIVPDYPYLHTASQGPWPNRPVKAVQEAASAMQYGHTSRGMPENAPGSAAGAAGDGARGMPAEPGRTGGHAGATWSGEKAV